MDEAHQIGTHQGRVLHVLPADLGRGAQHYAFSLREQTEATGWKHEVAFVFHSPEGVMQADHFVGTPIGRARRLGFDPRAAVGLRKLLDRERFDVVVAHGGEPFKYCRASVRRGVPLVYYRIGVSQPRAESGLRRSLYRLLARRADVVAGVSQEVLDDTRRWMSVPDGRLRLVPNGRDPAPYDRGRLGHRNDDREGPVRLISVGHLTTGKRPGWFLDVVKVLRDRGVDVEAQLVGDGPLFDELAPLAELAGVDLLGRRSDVPSLLSEADIFCFPSSGESEGMPGVLIEAGLSGLATVATDVPGAKTVIRHGETGFVTPTTDFAAFAAAVERIAASTELRSDMGTAALQRCQEHFTLDASQAAFEQMLDEVAGHSPAQQSQLVSTT